MPLEIHLSIFIFYFIYLFILYIDLFLIVCWFKEKLYNRQLKSSENYEDDIEN